MRFTDAYGEQSCTAGRASFITGPERLPDRAQQGRAAERAGRAAGGGPDDRRAPEEPRLLHGAVRQEPPRGQERVPADGARLRRVLREPLPPERRGGPRGSRLPGQARLPGVPGPLRPARGAAVPGDDEGRPEGAPALGTRRQAADPGHGAADPEADGDLRRRVRRRRLRLHPAPAQPAQAVLLLGEHHAHALPHAHQAAEPRQGRPLAVALPRHDARPRPPRRPAPRPARPARDRRRHDRHVRHRQRAAHEHVARRGDDPVPEREEHELGGRVPRPVDRALAREDPGRRRLQRDRPAPRLAAHVPRGRRRAGRRREAEGGPRGRRQDASRCTSTASTCSRT